MSNVGCYIYEDKVPMSDELLSTCEEFNLNPTTIALSGGEDYELLFTLPLKDYDKVKSSPNFHIIQQF
mgnify:CR=1 FL=1